MKIKINLKSEQNIELPIQYNHIVQAFIYNNIDEKIAKFLHDKGYVVNNRSFKLFNFSRIFGNYKIDKDNKKIIFESPIEIIIKTPIEDFAKSLMNNIILNSNLKLGDNKLNIENYEISSDIIEGSSGESTICIKTLSPITTYSTLKELDGTNYTYYFLPEDPKFENLINNNLKKKAEILNVNFNSGLKILNYRGKKRIIIYKNFVIKAFDGIFTISGNKELLNMVLSCRLGK